MRAPARGLTLGVVSNNHVVNPSVSQRDRALSSGGQVVHTDFPKGEPKFGTGYVVEFPTRVQARCNPVLTTPETCGPAVAVEPAP